ncbi:MAG TPA: nitrilase-related carbon-nitrogen hydrolase [Acidobacteriaceae bacterium]|jgi:apolipoprotein N-acyltransferase|nr:nitrilase-related carbon-nitrogen hydrolase [Acidobacteriaceae bacterium]
MAFVEKHPILAATLAVLATAALLLAGNGMNPVWPVMWIAFLPILLFAAETTSWLLAASAAALSMLLGSLTMLYYLHFVLRLPITAWLIPFSIASLLFAAGTLLFRALLHRGAVFSSVIALPAFWSVVEYLASFVPANGTAGSLAYTQQSFLPILQVASLTGPWGITFLLLLFPTALAATLYLRRRNLPHATLILASALALLAAAILFGTLRLAAPTSPHTVTIGLLDTDTVVFAQQPTEMQHLIQTYAQQAETLARRGATLIVMPEKTGLLLTTNTQTIDPILQSVADRTGATLILGVLHVVAPASFNEARIYTPLQPIATYDKQHMLPPFESDLTPGTALTLLSKSPAPIGVAICKDMDFIHPALDYGRAGIDLLLDPAWDFTLDRTWHGHIAIMRGVEGGYAIAHAAKSGFLTVTDDRGRILGETRTNTAPFATLLVNVPLHHDRTLFDRYGTWFPKLAALLLLAAGLRLATAPRRA